jgi:hypothetical protein
MLAESTESLPRPVILDFGPARAYPGRMKKAVFLSLLLVLVSTASAEIWLWAP